MKISFEDFVAMLAEKFGDTPEHIIEVDDFGELGLDSLSLFSVLTDVEERFGISVKVDDLTEIYGVRAMYKYVVENSSPVTSKCANHGEQQ